MTALSIITVNLNNGAGLQRTAQSVSEQTFSDFEFILIDGGSTDTSAEVISRFSNCITYAVSEQDRGIYHAMNKGIRQAQGQYCLFLNSGDWLSGPTVLEEVFAKKPEADLIAGNVFFYDNQQQQIKWHVESPAIMTARTLFLGTLSHQATFIRRSLFERVGMYNEQLSIASDWLFFIDALLVHHCSYWHFPGVVAYFNMDGISCDPATNGLARREQQAVLKERYPLFLADYHQLDERESDRQKWISSQEYAVYQALNRWGIIRLGVFVRRVKRVIRRTFARLW